MRDVHLVLHAGQRAELSLDDDAVIVGVLDDLARQGDVVLEALGGSVDHNGGKAAVDAGFAELEGIAVVKMQRNGDLRILDDGRLDQLDQIGMVRIGARTLRNLKDNGALQLSRSLGNALNDLHIVDVERADGVSPVIGFREHFFCRNKCHFPFSPFLKHYERRNFSQFGIFTN